MALPAGKSDVLFAPGLTADSPVPYYLCPMDDVSTLILLRDAIRRAVGPQAWAQGEKLVAMDAVEGIAAEDDRVDLRVHAPSSLLSPEVTLYPEDGEWECSCGAKRDCCAHVAAAIIALVSARESGCDLPLPARASVVLEYRFYRQASGLSLVRNMVQPNGAVVPLDRPLLAMVSARRLPEGLRPDASMLAADRLIGRHLHPDRALPAGVLSGLLGELAQATVFLNDVPIRTGTEPLLPCIAIDGDGAGGAILRLEPNPDADEIVAPGVALSAGCLLPLGQRDICGDCWQKLPARMAFAKEDMAHLVSEILPRLSRDNFVHLTAPIPPVSRFLTPRIVFHVQQGTPDVRVTPELVYGNPPHVTIRENRMVYMEGSIPVRNPAAERDIETRLRDEMNLVTGRTVSCAGRDAARMMDQIRRWEAARDPAESSRRMATPLRPVVRVTDDTFDLLFTTGSLEDGSDGQTASASNVIGAYQDGMSMAALNGGGFAPLPTRWLDAHAGLVQDILNARDDDRRVATHALPLLARLCEDLDLPPPSFVQRIRPLLDAFESIPDVPLPPDCTAQLRDYQKAGINWLHFLRSLSIGALLADDMGLGKTLQALCAIKGRTLVVCPTSVMHNWAMEASRFRPGLRVCVFHGTNRQLDADADLCITNFALLRIERARLMRSRAKCAVLDEAQNIKNPSSQSAKAACRLRAEFRLAMTGTPVENRLEELWSIFQFLNPGYLGGYSDFQRRFVVPMNAGDPDAAARLRRRIAPYLLRRTKSEVEPELPPRTDIVLKCELDETERTIYDALRAASSAAAIRSLQSGGSVINALELLLRLRQAACHSDMIPGCNADGSSKIDLLIEVLGTSIANGHKALVFSQWTRFLDLIEPHLRRAGIPFGRLDGRTVDRAGVVRDFQEQPGQPVLLISLKAGGTGLNLTAADHVFILDPWWNPATEDQAADRTHRIGQDRHVMVYRLIASATVEEKILALQEKKRKIAAAALQVGDQALSLTRDDLLELLG